MGVRRFIYRGASVWVKMAHTSVWVKMGQVHRSAPTVNTIV